MSAPPISLLALLAATLVVGHSSVQAQTPAPGTVPTAVKEEAVATADTALTDPRFIALVQEAQSLHATQKNFDALEKLDEAEVFQPNSPLIPNVRGSIYTAMRDFEKARINFQKAEALSPAAFEPKFNLVELDYVGGNFAASESGFMKLLNDYPKLRLEVRHLTLFKVLVSRLKQDNVSGALELMKNFSFMDDTPAYYFSKAAFAFQEGRKDVGREWLGKATGIYKQTLLVPYVDSLMEARWVESLGVTEAKPAP
ncbi:MAG: hypothetical protein ACAI34_18060 [Verrucomicrobium sp.]